MATKLLQISGRAGMLAQRQPRAAIGGAMLGCMFAELIAAAMVRGGV